MDPVVTYDRRSFCIDKAPKLILSGSVHYPRLHPSRYQTLFDSFHASHLNTLETYVFWNFHDTSSSTSPSFPPHCDLFKFISSAHDNKLYVILRIGPYICAEVNYGGFPARLRDKPGIKLRTQNEAFQAEVEKWVTYLRHQLHERNLMASRGGPIILVQLENEYSMVSDAYGDDGSKYLQWTADLQKSLDFGVPGIMCYGAADGVVETINAFYAHKELPQQRKNHPDQPPVWTECWTGWYDVWGTPHHVRPVEDLAYAVARFFAQGGAGVNYYMWMGGTNFGRSTMYLQKTSYDYDAPIDEFYQVTTKGKHLTRLHAVLLDCFANSFHGQRTTDPSGEGGVFDWGDVCFVCNDGNEPIKDIHLESEHVHNKTVKPRSVHILDSNGGVLFDTSEIQDEDIVQRTRRLVPVKVVKDWICRAEQVPCPSNVEDVGIGRVMESSEGPVEQLLLTKDETDYCYYTARYTRQGTLRSDHVVSFEAADFATVFVNGEVVGRTKVPLWEDRWPNTWNTYEDVEAPGTRNEIPIHGEIGETIDVTILTSALGLVKGDWQLGEGRTMLDERKGLLTDVLIEGYARSGKWTSICGLAGEKERYWEKQWLEGTKKREINWYQCVVVVKKMENNLVVDLGGCGKGLLYVNEHLVGRYWLVAGTRPMNGFLDGSPIRQVDAGEPSQRYYHIPAWMGKQVEGGVELRVTLFAEEGAHPATISIYAVE